MYTDLPQCLRCCFCFPLRYSLAVWGYFKLITSVIFLGVLFWSLIHNLIYNYIYHGYFIVLSISIALLLLDSSFDIVLIIAAHKKNAKMFQYYYYYSVVILAIFVIIITILLGYQIMLLITVPYLEILLPATIENIFCFLGISLAQVYITLLVRTEMVKLRNNCKFEFVNNAVES